MAIEAMVGCREQEQAMAKATKWLLLGLVAEKVVQHAVVSWALVNDEFGLRSAIAFDYRWFVLVGAVVGVLFAVALIGLIGWHRWSLVLLVVLASADIVGEFAAQGTLAISITLSLAVAVVVLTVALRALRPHEIKSWRR
jgi:hypothetical protein